MIEMEWQRPWIQIDEAGHEVAAAIEQELHREVGVGHPLHGIRVRAIGRRMGCDDFAFQLTDGTGRIAVVHLTFCAGSPDRLLWPITELYENIASWIDQRMNS